MRTNLASYSNYYGIPNIVSGKYEEKIIDILKNKKGQNVFLYIDPYGIRALDTALFDKFQAMGFHSFEMLINFNSFGFFRDACRVMAVDYKNDSALQDIDDLVEYDPTSVVTLDKPVDTLSNIAGVIIGKRLCRIIRKSVLMDIRQNNVCLQNISSD